MLRRPRLRLVQSRPDLVNLVVWLVLRFRLLRWKHFSSTEIGGPDEATTWSLLSTTWLAWSAVLATVLEFVACVVWEPGHYISHGFGKYWGLDRRLPWGQTLYIKQKNSGLWEMHEGRVRPISTNFLISYSRLPFSRLPWSPSVRRCTSFLSSCRQLWSLRSVPMDCILWLDQYSPLMRLRNHIARPNTRLCPRQFWLLRIRHRASQLAQFMALQLLVLLLWREKTGASPLWDEMLTYCITASPPRPLRFQLPSQQRP